jgi:hypothetical protein
MDPAGPDASEYISLYAADRVEFLLFVSHLCFPIDLA